MRERVAVQEKAPVQLELFVPHLYGYDFTVVLSHKLLAADKRVAYHNGRGSEEAIFAQLKSHHQIEMAYVPTRPWCGNQVYLLSAVLAHNLTP